VFEPEFGCVLMDGKRYLGLTNNLNWLAWSSWMLRWYSNIDLILIAFFSVLRAWFCVLGDAKPGGENRLRTPIKACSRIRSHFLGFEAHDEFVRFV